MNKSNYRKILALILIIIFGIWLLYLFYLQSFISPILTAIVLSLLFYPLYEYLLKKTKRKVVSAFIVIFGLLLLIIALFSVLSTMVYSQFKDLDVSVEKLEFYEDRIYDLTGIEINIANAAVNIEEILKREFNNYLSTIVSFTSNFLLAMFIVFFVMFYLLMERKQMVVGVISIMPFSKVGSKYLLSESSKRVKAILIGQLLTAIIQGLLGMFSFLVAGIEGAIFWGFIMIILSIIPVVGAFLVWVPAGLFLLFEGSIISGVFVLAWGFIVVSNIDNFIRPALVNKFAKIHPLETFIGIFLGLGVFGLIGIVVGPIIISLFLLLIEVFKKEYSDV